MMIEKHQKMSNSLIQPTLGAYLCQVCLYFGTSTKQKLRPQLFHGNCHSLVRGEKYKHLINILGNKHMAGTLIKFYMKSWEKLMATEIRENTGLNNLHLIRF